MELRHLRYLVAIAEAGTFVRAAETIRVAQPALTRQLRDLAEELDVELFEKGARKATLTKAGEASVRLARHVLQDTERALTRARMSNAGLVGECVISCGPFMLRNGYVGRLNKRIRTKYPGISLRLLEMEGRPMWDVVVNGEADIALGIQAPPTYPSLNSERQMVDTVEFVLVDAKHPLAGRKAVSVEDLRKYPMLSLDNVRGTYLETILLQYLRAADKEGSAPPNVEYLPSFHSMLSHARAKLGWTFIPTSVAKSYAPLVPVLVTDFRMPYPTARTWRRIDDRPVVRTVIDELKAMEKEADDPAAPTPKRNSRSKNEEGGLPVRLELRHLRSYEQVVRYGSFGRAAEATDISQPALSRQMKDLEYDVGVPLFARGSRGVELTPAGKAFAADAKGILAIVAHIKTEAKRAQRGSAQACVIGVVAHSYVDRLVAELVSRTESFKQAVRIGTQMLGTPSIPNALENSEIDVAVGFTYPIRVPPNHNLKRVPLFDDEMSCALLPVSHPLAKADSLSVADLADVPFLFPPRETFPPVHSVVMHQFEKAGVRPRIDNTYEGVLTIWAVAAQGEGWALGLKEQASEPPLGLVSIPLKDFRLPWGGEVVYRSDESRASVLAVVDGLITHAAELFGPRL